MSLLVDIEKKLGCFTLRTRFETDNSPMALLGASGSGKSVTLKCIAGIMTPDRGRIVLDGETLFDSAARVDLPPQRRRVGYLFQQYALFPHMTVEQNLLCALRGLPRQRQRLRAAELLRRFRLEGLERNYPAQLSGGQQQRVALARILATEPRAILLDEPFSALDSFLRWQLELELWELLADFRGPILWVSHDLGECCRNCGSVCVMEEGQSGPVTDYERLLRSPATAAQARLVGIRDFLPGQRRENGVFLPGWNITLPLSAPAEQLTVAIPDGALTPGAGPYRARVLRLIRDLNGSAALLSPIAGEAPPLRAALPEGYAPAPGEVVPFSLCAERCLCYPASLD